jgi:hypothetical protein
MEELEIAYHAAVGKPEGNKPRGRSRRRSQNNIKKDLVETERECLDWTNLV